MAAKRNMDDSTSRKFWKFVDRTAELAKADSRGKASSTIPATFKKVMSEPEERITPAHRVIAALEKSKK